MKLVLTVRLERVMETWISNPGAKLEFIRLIEDAHLHPRADDIDQELLNWVGAQRAALRRIGVAR